MSYKIKKTDTGCIVEKRMYHCFKHQPGNVRRKRTKPTPECMKKVNTAHAVDKLFFKLCANFTENDLYITLKYDGEVNKSIACVQMKEDVKKFLRLMRAQYKKQSKIFKYIYAYGISANKVRHIHMVVSRFDEKAIQKCWKRATDHAGRISFEFLWSDYEYRGLAEYLVKNGLEAKKFDSEAFAQTYTPSRNLIKPKVSVKAVTRSSTFREKPKIDAGYELIKDSVRNGYDCYGFRFFKYLMRKKE